MHKHLLIATDGSELAQKAVDQGFDLAIVSGSRRERRAAQLIAASKG